MAEKKSIMLYLDSMPQWDLLTDKQAGQLIKALMHYYESGVKIQTDDGMLRMAFSFFATQIDRDTERWTEVCKRRASAGKKGGAPKGNTNAQKQAKGCFDSQNQANQAKQPDRDRDRVRDRDRDRDRDSVSVIQEGAAAPPGRQQQQLIPPSLQAVSEYAAELHSTVNPESFVDYYTANGWMCGRNPMKDWKAVFRNWTKRERASDVQTEGAPSLDLEDIDRLINDFGGAYE